MNILSCFDGMSCGQLALNRAGVKYDNYFASEIDKYSISVTQQNYPNTIQLGDIKTVSIKLTNVDLLIGGSPCQGFSFAGKRLNFNDERSALFFEFVKLLNETNPKYFLLENVKMKKEHQAVITQYLGVEPILINSALVSAQNRNRLYWTNIPNVTQPEDKKIFLKDILESGVTDRQKDFCLDANYFKGGNLNQYFNKKRRQLIFQVNTSKEAGNKQPRMQNRVYSVLGKSPCLTLFCNRLNVTEDLVTHRKLTPVECERLQTVPDNYTALVSNQQRYKMLGNGWTVDVIAHILKGIQ